MHEQAKLSNELKTTQRLLLVTSARLNHAAQERDTYRESLSQKEEVIGRLQARIADLRDQRHNERRQLCRSRIALKQAREKIKALLKSSKHAERARQYAEEEEGRTRADAETAIRSLEDRYAVQRDKLTRCLGIVRTLQKRCARFPRVLEARIEQAKTRPTVFRLKQKGIYTNHARALARVLIRCGCSQRKVGEVVQLVGKALGITVLGRMSAHTVRRVVLEGGIASDLQMGFELSKAKGE